MNDENFGFIHSLETFGTVDGPGIRFIIFMQGCRLKCKYCHNRDSWAEHSGITRTVDVLVKKILRYKDYIIPSGGGVTVSGGEPLLQSKFIINLFKQLKCEGIHTALDTAGSLEINTDIKKLLEVTDLVLLDIKHIDNEKCINLTGFSNHNTLEFAKYLSNNHIPIWIRQVIVPGITDEKEDLIKLKDFISSLNNLKKVELLPYHSMGKYKWIKLGLKYPLDDIPDATDEDINRAKTILNI